MNTEAKELSGLRILCALNILLVGIFSEALDTYDASFKIFIQTQSVREIHPKGSVREKKKRGGGEWGRGNEVIKVKMLQKLLSTGQNMTCNVLADTEKISEIKPICR